MWVGEEKGDGSNVDSIHNKAFQEYYAQQEQGAKDALLDVMSEPFEMIDDIVNVWFKDFEEEVSCYTYLSFLGQDFFFTTFSLGVQILVPLVLLRLWTNADQLVFGPHWSRVHARESPAM